MDDQTHSTPTPNYEWALDALIDVLILLNRGEPDGAKRHIQKALWDPAHHPKLTS